MKHVHEIGYTPTPNANADIAERNRKTAVSAVEYSFRGLSAIFPSSNKMTFATPEIMNETKKQWARAYLERGILNQKIIDGGLKAARGKATGRFPTCGQFIQWCLESEDDSFERYIRRKPLTDLAERATACEVGWQCRTQLNERDARRLWTETLTGFKSDVACGRLTELPEQRRVDAPETMTANLTQEQRDNKTLKAINDLLAQGYQPRGALKSKGIELGLLNPDGSMKQ